VLEVRDLSRHTPVCGIIRRILEQVKQPISCDELTVHVLEAWQRNFPPNPYDDPVLIYKLVGKFKDVEMHYDDLPDIPMIEEDGRDPVLVNPRLGYEELNEAVEQIKRIKFSLKH
jgi:hypothetical protein